MNDEHDRLVRIERLQSLDRRGGKREFLRINEPRPTSCFLGSMDFLQHHSERNGEVRLASGTARPLNSTVSCAELGSEEFKLTAIAIEPRDDTDAVEQT